jgi:hypothetical protein
MSPWQSAVMVIVTLGVAWGMAFIVSRRQGAECEGKASAAPLHGATHSATAAADSPSS